MNSNGQRHGIIVRQGEVKDAPAIIKLRAEWYERIEKPALPTLPNAQWIVGEWALSREVIAAMTVLAVTQGFTFIGDLFCVSDRRGKLAIRAFLEKLHGLEGQKAVSVPVENEGLLKILRGAGYRDAEIVLTEGTECPASSPLSSVSSAAS